MNHAPTRPTAQWVVRRGFIGGSPWPRGMALLLWGAPVAVWWAWACGWALSLRGAVRPMVLALLALALLGVGLVGLTWRRPTRRSTSQLCWHGPWPGEVADELGSGFTVDGCPVVLHGRLRWGQHLCVSWGADGRSEWGWLKLSSDPADRALKVLMSLHRPSDLAGGSSPEESSAPSPSVRSAQSVASCASDARRPAPRSQTGGSRRKAPFASTEIMQEKQGMALEAGRPHGSPGRRT